MSTTDAYANIVQLYDLEHADFTDDVEFLLELAQLGEGTILELGCGTGRVLKPLAAAGIRVVGIDSSDAMMEEARQNLDPAWNVSLVTADMTDVTNVSGEPFGMIVASLNSIMHLTSQYAQQKMIQTAWTSLQPAGRLVIDTFNPSVDQLNHLLGTTHLEGSWTLDNGEVIDKWGYRQSGADSQIIDTLIWYDQTNANGEYHRTRTRFDLRYVHQSELALMLEIAGFTDVDWYGDYDLNPWGADSERIIAIAHKDEE